MPYCIDSIQTCEMIVHIQIVQIVLVMRSHGLHTFNKLGDHIKIDCLTLKSLCTHVNLYQNLLFPLKKIMNFMDFHCIYRI